MSGFCVWMSKSSAVAKDGTALSVVKYDDKVRKQAALVLDDERQSVVVAYFRDEDEARRVADLFFGGVRIARWWIDTHGGVR